MELKECKALERDLVPMRLLEAPQSELSTDTEVGFIVDNGRRFLVHGNQILSVDYVNPGDAHRYEAGECLWCLAEQKDGLLKLRSLRCSGSLSLDIQIGVDDRLVDQLHSQRRINEPRSDLACDWLRDELLLDPIGNAGGARALARSDGNGARMTLIGRRREADLDQRNGRWVITRLTPARQHASALTLLRGKLEIVDISVAGELRSASQRRLLQEHLDAHGDYIELWRRYAAMEWGRATEAGLELSILRYQAREPYGEEQLRWRYQVDPEHAKAFIQRWEGIVRGDNPREAPIEARQDPPAWMRDDHDVAEKERGRPVIGDRPRLDGAWLTLSYDPNRDHDAPPASGLLCLSIHGERKVHERREQALERIRTSQNAMPQLRVLLEGQPVPIRTDWRKQEPLSKHARAAFRGAPTAMQKRALDRALNTPDIAIIIGPPGTGKTQMISALQRRLAEVYPDPRSLQYQLLITSFQHDAVDNALARVEVLGLPPMRVGGRRSDEQDAMIDRLSGWRAKRDSELRPRLEAAVADQPVFAALGQLREAMTVLRIQPLTPADRADRARDIDAGLRRLEVDYDLRPDAATLRRWRDWMSTLSGGGEVGAKGANRELWRRAVWALRTCDTAFLDDGPSQCLRLLDLAGRLGQSLTESEHSLLNDLAEIRIPQPDQLKALGRLQDRLLDASRGDLRPPVIRNALDSEGCALLDALLADLDRRIQRRPEWARLAILADYLDDMQRNPDELERAVRAYTTVLGASCQQSASESMRQIQALNPNDGISFDTVVVDEAARATPLDLLIPMAMGRRRIVLVGDHRQLPHLLDPQTEKEMEQTSGLKDMERNALKESLFERLVQGLRRLREDNPDQPERVIMLDTQFRMHPVLGEFVSKSFYEAVGEKPIVSALPGENFEHRVRGLEGCVCAWIDIPVREVEDRAERMRNGSRIRRAEAKRAALEARRILDECPDLSIGVIAFYAAQRDLILECMNEQNLSEYRERTWRIRPEWARDVDGNERLLVGTVDAFQGKEFDIVLLSIVRTDEPMRGDDQEINWTRKYGFLRLPNRMNVAMSRQKRLLIALGDAALPRAPEAPQAAPGLAAFMELCEGEYGRVL
jgi:hypothetical protein